MIFMGANHIAFYIPETGNSKWALTSFCSIDTMYNGKSVFFYKKIKSEYLFIHITYKNVN